MEARGDLMLAIQSRTFSNYFLMESTNKNQPANFIDNKVTGILFEGKVDHITLEQTSNTSKGSSSPLSPLPHSDFIISLVLEMQ